MDSGAMYRCVALLSLAAPGREPGELAGAAAIELGGSGAAGDGVTGGGMAGGGMVRLDGRDVSEAIRAPEVSEAASVVAANPAVRDALVAKQRELIAHGDWVAEGRDIGTVVAPDAELKVFLTADATERARCRARRAWPARRAPSGRLRPARRRAGAPPSWAQTSRRCSPSRPCATSATARALGGVGGQEDLQLGIGRDDGADVAALGHPIAVGDQLALLGHERISHGLSLIHI